MGVSLADPRLDRKRRARARQLRRADVRQAGRYGLVAWLAHILRPPKETP